jgi:plastocyanin
MRPHLRMLAILWIGLLAAPLAAAAQATGTLRGRVVLGIDGVGLAEMGPIVVYVDAEEGGDSPPPATPPPRVEQKNATFSPGFLVIARGQSVEMRNDDAIYHNVFSFSKPNDFDLGTYPAGKSRSVTFKHAGVVRTYCSIHDSMRGTIFVAPTRHFATVDGAGRFVIRDVPVGRRRVRTWCERLPDASAEVDVAAETTTLVELSLGRPGR